MKFAKFVKNREMVNGLNVQDNFVVSGFIRIAISTYKQEQTYFLIIIKNNIFVHFAEEYKNVR